MKSYSKRMKWERILSYIMLLIVTTMLFSCGDANYISPVELGQKQNKIIMEALKAKDKEKLQQCFNNNIDVMIEDSPSNIQYMSKEIKVIKFDCQYNRHVDNENISTAYSWYHIYNIIEEMKGE